MERIIQVSYPESLAHYLRLVDTDFKNEIKTVSLIKLYEIGKISSGTAAKILGISRIEFLQRLGKYQVSLFNYKDESELTDDISNA